MSLLFTKMGSCNTLFCNFKKPHSTVYCGSLFMVGDVPLSHRRVCRCMAKLSFKCSPVTARSRCCTVLLLWSLLRCAPLYTHTYIHIFFTYSTVIYWFPSCVPGTVTSWGSAVRPGRGSVSCGESHSKQAISTWYFQVVVSAGEGVVGFLL